MIEPELCNQLLYIEGVSLTAELGFQVTVWIPYEPPQQTEEMTTITLTEKQRRRAKDVLQRLSNDEVTEPTDIVERWDNEPDYDKLDTEKPVLEMNLQREQKYVSVPDIIGTGAGAADRLEQDRLKAVLELLIEGEFEQEHKYPPKIEGIGGKYYVAVDGVHRTLAFKTVGLIEIYAEVIEIPLK